MWLILQHHEPDDFVVATGQNHSVREFVELAFKEVGIAIRWEGQVVNEVGLDESSGKKIVLVDPGYFRPTEVDELLGDPSKTNTVLGWAPKITFEEMVKRMLVADLKEAEKALLCWKNGL